MADGTQELAGLEDIDDAAIEAGFAAALAQIDEWSELSRGELKRARASQAALERLRVAVWSPGHEVRVVVDHPARLHDVEFDPKALTTPPSALGAATTAAIRRALDRLAREAERIATEVAGEGTPMAASLLATYAPLRRVEDDEAPQD